jgi:hypothetical protein
MSEAANREIAAALGRFICGVLEHKPPQFGLAFVFATGQGHPVLYLATQSGNQAQKTIRDLAQQQLNEFGSILNSLVANQVTEVIEKLERKQLEHPGTLEIATGHFAAATFDTGYWDNPAGEILDECGPAITEWATRAFQAISDAPDEDGFYAALDHLRLTLWAALDFARKRFEGTWPSISFVQSVDDNMHQFPSILTERKSADQI